MLKGTSEGDNLASACMELVKFPRDPISIVSYETVQRCLQDQRHTRSCSIFDLGHS